jgi:hypothetical protein
MRSLASISELYSKLLRSGNAVVPLPRIARIQGCLDLAMTLIAAVLKSRETILSSRSTSADEKPIGLVSLGHDGHSGHEISMPIVQTRAISLRRLEGES